jgi:hypothetical protein
MCLQLEIAVRTPDSAIERNHEGPLRQQITRRHRLTVRIVEHEIGRFIAGLKCALRLAAGDQFRGGALHSLELSIGRLEGEFAALEVGFQSVEAILQGHDILQVWLCRLHNLAYSLPTRYTREMDNIYLLSK